MEGCQVDARERFLDCVLKGASALSVWSPLNVATLTWETKVYNLLVESSSSLRILAKRTRTLKGTFLTPWDQMCLFNLVSILTSSVPICFSANFLISLMARGARYLNPIPCNLLWRLIVYSRVTTSPMVDPFFSLGMLKF